MKYSILNLLGLVGLIQKFIIILEYKTSKLAEYFRKEESGGTGEENL